MTKKSSLHRKRQTLRRLPLLLALAFSGWAQADGDVFTANSLDGHYVADVVKAIPLYTSFFIFKTTA